MHRTVGLMYDPAKLVHVVRNLPSIGDTYRCAYDPILYTITAIDVSPDDEVVVLLEPGGEWVFFDPVSCSSPVDARNIAPTLPPPQAVGESQ